MLSENKKQDHDEPENDMLVNNLVYEQPEALSLAVSRNSTNQHFQRNDYKSGETAIINVNSGSAYIDTENSYLTFKIKLVGTSTPTANFGSGSAFNLLRQATTKTKSGVELDRIERLNHFDRNNSAYKFGDSYLKKMGESQGYGPTRVLADDAANMSDTAFTRFCLPLSRVCPFYAPLKRSMKIPPQLMSGSQLELIFEDFRTALCVKSGTITDYLISDIRISVDSIALSDDTQKSLNFESSESGLEYSYARIYTGMSSLTASQASVSTQISLAVSQGCMAFAVVVDQASLIDITVDSFKTVPWNSTSFQWRLGSLYYPQAVLQDETKDGVESYVVAQMVFDKLKHQHAESSVSLTDFKAGYGMMAVSLEKDTSLGLSGMPINNSRLLQLNANFTAVDATRELLVFLEYCAVSRAYIDNVAVSI
jgi:hypothetical protein